MPSGVVWTEEAEEPRRRRGIPTWLWVSAAGCLGFVVLLILASGWLIGFVQRRIDPREQWAAIREVIAVDEPPPPLFVFGPPRMKGMKSWWMTDPNGTRQAMLYHLRGDGAGRIKEELRGARIPDAFGSRLQPQVPVESGAIMVQGRALPFVRCRFQGRDANSEEKKGRFDFRIGPRRTGSGSRVRAGLVGPAILVDLSAEASPEFLGLVLVTPDGAGRIEEAQVIDFLRPFHVGPDR